MDPLTAPALGLGAASLAIQVFDGVKSGYRNFEVAVQMPADCESFKLRLRIEYTRLLDWGDLAGLTDESKHGQFDTRLRANRAIIMALLSEMESLLKNLSKLVLKYDELQWRESSPSTTSGAELVAIPKVGLLHSETASKPRANPRANSKEVLQKGDFSDKQMGLFKSSYVANDMKKYPKGFNHIINISRGVWDVTKNPERIVWAVHNKEKFEEQLKRLTQLTTYLHETLTDHQLEALVQSGKKTWMAMLQVAKSVDEVKALLSAASIARIPQNHLREDGSPSHSETSTLAGEPGDQPMLFEKLAAFRARYKETYSPHGFADESGKLDIDVNKLKLGSMTERGPRTRASYDSDEMNVWVEWKNYSLGIVEKDGETDLDVTDQTMKNVRRLVTLLKADEKPKEFRIPRCLGYYRKKDPNQFGFVFEVPRDAPTPAQPYSLLQLLGGEVVPIMERISLAKQLATYTLHLHAVDWLHKALRSASITFFSPDKNHVDVTKPFISGFEYARPDEKGLTTTKTPSDQEWAIYCHPDYQGQEREGNYRRTYDIYSLGIILLEIAYWKKAEDILGFRNVENKESEKDRENETVDASRTSQAKYDAKNIVHTRGIRDRLLYSDKKLLNYVRVTMGNSYARAVEACIGGPEFLGIAETDDQTDGITSAYLQDGFLEVVIDPLSKVVI